MNRRNRTPEEIQANIDAATARMTSTIDELGERFKPRSLFEDAMGKVLPGSMGHNASTVIQQQLRARGPALAVTLGTTIGFAVLKTAFKVVRRHPIPVAIAALGIAGVVLKKRANSPAARGYRSSTSASYPPASGTTSTGLAPTGITPTGIASAAMSHSRHAESPTRPATTPDAGPSAYGRQASTTP